MDFESVKRYVETGGYEEDKNASIIEKMPLRFFERFIMQGLHVDLIEPGRVVCSMKVPPRLLVITSNPKSLCFYVVFRFKYIIKDLKMIHLGSWDNHHRWILYAHAWWITLHLVWLLRLVMKTRESSSLLLVVFN